MSNQQEPAQPGSNPPQWQPPQGTPLPPQAPPQQHGAPQQYAPGSYAPPPPGQPGQDFPPPGQGYGVPGPSFPPPGQYGAGQYGAPPAKSRKTLWIVLGVVGGVLVLGVVAVLLLVNIVNGATNKARSLADDFTTMVVKGQSEEAYDTYFHTALKAKMDKDEFVEGIAGLELDDSCKPDYSSVNLSSENGNNVAEFSGTLKCSDQSIDLRYVFEGKDDLKMSTIRLRP